MTTPSLSEQTGISILVEAPLLATSLSLSPFTVTNQISAYSHEIKAVGGYWAASFTLASNQNELEGWLQDGIGRHITVHNSALEIIWEGFVNEIDLTLGDLTAKRGPLLDITSRVYVTYTPMNFSTDPPTRGATDTLGPFNDTASQDKYGIVARTISASETSAGGAQQDAETWLEENREPKTDEQLGQPGGQQVVISCLGYVHWLDAYPYLNTPATGTVTLSTKIEDVLDADPNSLFASTNAAIATNALLVRDENNEQRTGWNVITGLVARGDNTDARYLFGIFANRKAVYAAAPTDETAYYRRISDTSREITTPTGSIVRPWDVDAGQWLFFPDFLVGRTQPSDRRLDPRYLFIESVKYTAPYSANLQGGRLDTIPQKLAKAGLAGVGA